MKDISELRAEHDRLLTRLAEINANSAADEDAKEGASIMQDLNWHYAEIASLERSARHAEISGTLGFHWTEGRYFQRRDNGSVRIVKFAQYDQEPQEIMTIDANSWASIMCSVSGDCGPGRWDEARHFHRVAS